MASVDGLAPQLLREARRRADITQAELARRAGIPRSVVSVYESGRRQPSAEALGHLLAAAGFDLRLTTKVREVDPQRAGRILEQVLDLAEALPGRRRGPLRFPPFPRASG
jgi:transcriptional regulator with XRE-family HTH domain